MCRDVPSLLGAPCVRDRTPGVGRRFVARPRLDPDLTSASTERGGRSESGSIQAGNGGTLYEAQGGEACPCGAWRGELGLEPTPELYVDHLASVFDEVHRVLRVDGTIWLNLGDTFATHPVGVTGEKRWRNSTLANRDFTGHEQAGRMDKRAPGLKPKDLVGIPWRVAFELQRRGWWLRSDCIWAKPNPMPESVVDRPTRSHEYVFLLTKAGRYFYDGDAVRQALRATTLHRLKYHTPNAADNPNYRSKHSAADFRRYPMLNRAAPIRVGPLAEE